MEKFLGTVAALIMLACVSTILWGAVYFHHQVELRDKVIGKQDSTIVKLQSIIDELKTKSHENRIKKNH